MKRWRAWSLALVVCLASGAASAHGDEDHGAPPAAGNAVRRGEHVAAAETDLYSVVVKYPYRGAGGRLRLRVYVADSASSAPVVGARVRMEIAGVADVRPAAVEPGVYAVTIPEPRAGTHANAIVTVEGEAVDIVTLDGLHFGPPAGAPATPVGTAPAVAGRRRMALIIGGSIAALAIVALALGAVGRRRRPAGVATSASDEASG